jgi:hypothetical protein
MSNESPDLLSVATVALYSRPALRFSAAEDMGEKAQAAAERT